ncbi:MAG: DUF3662 domain-containing protein [Chloroflexi bacterium]|nr:DUF3662 domain-containing protein [Chloroflexota bacterium]
MEDLTRKMIEGALGHLLRGRLRPAEVLYALVCAIKDARAVGVAPDEFRVRFNDADLAHMQEARPDLVMELAVQVRQVLLQMGLQVNAVPRMILSGAAEIAPHQIEVRAQVTQVTIVQRAAVVGIDGLPRRPFLLLEGSRQIDLIARYVAIGRARENDVIVDDMRVSRLHLALRWLDDVQRFLAVDLGSRGGTTLNGHVIRQCTLEAGDVISLGGYDVIYGEEFRMQRTDAFPPEDV